MAAHEIHVHAAYSIGQTVHLKTRPERLMGMVTGYVVRTAEVVYTVAWGDATSSDHYDFELSEKFDPEFDPQ